MAILLKSDPDDTRGWEAELARRLPGVEVRIWPEVGDPAEIEFCVGWAFPPGSLRGFPKLKGLQSLGAGVDHVFRDPVLPAHLPIARIVDPYMTEDMTQWVMLNVLRFHKQDPDYRRLQAEGRWHELPPLSWQARRVGVMGLGELGGHALARLRHFGYPLAGWSRTAKRVDGVETFAGEAGLQPFLARTDILVALLPLTPATENLLDRRRLSWLPPGACVINAGRGRLIVDEDLIALLDSGHLGGAALDVFRREPLEPDHPFWRHPSVIVAPHVSALTRAETAAPQIVENYRRALAGEPLLHLVDRQRRY
ncbi:MAG: glyoxylate/hydroxypyruvate reductase A [Alphaproteobacteria bacterium]|nr:glyoxylate/hydroxypyruvate reductase A [Alphaproteobacteria bacterium]